MPFELPCLFDVDFVLGYLIVANVGGGLLFRALIVFMGIVLF